MHDSDNTARAFSTFRVLNEASNLGERDQLFRNMAQLFAYVSDRCDDDQVGQYDEVLCQLAGLVDIDARAHVAALLAPLARAPGGVVVKLSNDDYVVAQPLLERSDILTDDDLIEIVTEASESHRAAIAGRARLTERVVLAIAEHGESESLSRLARNPTARISAAALTLLVDQAESDPGLLADLRGRSDLPWAQLGPKPAAAARRLGMLAANEPLEDLALSEEKRERTSFSQAEWAIAYNQVRALNDRKQLDQRALCRFARFGYGHHAAAALCVMLRIAPETMVKWLADQDYVAMTVALRTAGVDNNLFGPLVAMLPWRDAPTESDVRHMVARFAAIIAEEAQDIFDMWRTHAFRRRNGASQSMAGAA